MLRRNKKSTSNLNTNMCLKWIKCSISSTSTSVIIVWSSNARLNNLQFLDLQKSLVNAVFKKDCKYSRFRAYIQKYKLFDDFDRLNLINHINFSYLKSLKISNLNLKNVERLSFLNAPNLTPIETYPQKRFHYYRNKKLQTIVVTKQIPKSHSILLPNDEIKQ
jgi:hypothetical protein